MHSTSSITSQLPKPVECIEIETDGHWCVPPIVVDGEVVTSFQYLTLHDTDKYLCDECKFIFILFCLMNKIIYTFLCASKTHTVLYIISLTVLS